MDQPSNALARPLAKRIATLAPSATIAMAQMSRELRAQGHDIIDLSLGEPDFDVPDHIKEGCKRAIDDDYSHYTPVAGYLDVREAICAKFKRDNGLNFEPNQIVMSTGAKQSIVNVVLCLVDPGDEVILPVPFWVSYSAMVHLAEGKAVQVQSEIENDFKITPKQLEAAITDKTKLMIFSSPCNPTGSVYTREELEGLAAVIASKEDLFVISDEIYEWINFTDVHASIGTIDSIRDRVITVNGLSKGYAMTGYRLGYLGAPEWIAKACGKMQGQFTSATCSITQRTVIAALNGSHEPTMKMKAAFLDRRAKLHGWLSEIEGVKINEPQGAFYFFPDISSFFGKSHKGEVINDANELCLYLLKEGGLSVVTGAAFGAPNNFRITYAASEDTLREAAKRLKSALEQLK